MNEGKSEVQRLLDLLVYVPVGLLQGGTEEFDELAEVGRHRVEGELHTARLVGQFVVQTARRQTERALRAAFARMVGGGGDPGEIRAGTAQADRLGAGRTDVNGHGDSAACVVKGSTTIAKGGELAKELAIPGYDSLSASQVVQRLGGLSRVELEDVKDHELVHRHRRTILNRIDQLLFGAVAERR
ncbi:MAG: hypothetical protein ABSH04_02540 [Acidimicrobiales bacterium]|jgi:hypothetical protein